MREDPARAGSPVCVSPRDLETKVDASAFPRSAADEDPCPRKATRCIECRFFTLATMIAGRSNARGTSSNLRSRFWRSRIHPFYCAGKCLNHLRRATRRVARDGLFHRKTPIALIAAAVGRRARWRSAFSPKRVPCWWSACAPEVSFSEVLAANLPDGLLPSELTGPANGLGFFARPPLRRLLVGSPLFHFPEDALALHLLLQNTKRLVDIVVANKYLQLNSLLGCEMRQSCVQPITQESRCGCEDDDGAILRRPRTRQAIGAAIQFDHSRMAVSIDKALLTRPIRSSSNGARSNRRNYFGTTSLQKCESHICWIRSISRCALLNAPAGSFSKDIDEVEVTA
jgi:hypothetical protein